MDARRLLAYHHHLWRRFADFYVEDCTWDELSRDHGTSHGSIANVTMHAVNMEDWWLHSIVPGREWDGPKWDGFRDARSMRQRIHEVEAKTRNLLDGMPEGELRAPIRVLAGDDKMETTLEEILVEVVNEATHHRGEVLAMLWRTDHEPPYESFLEWAKRAH